MFEQTNSQKSLLLYEITVKLTSEKFYFVYTAVLNGCVLSLTDGSQINRKASVSRHLFVRCILVILVTAFASKKFPKVARGYIDYMK